MSIASYASICIVVLALGCARQAAPAATPVTTATARPVDTGEPAGMPEGYVEMKAETVVALPDEQAALLLLDETEKIALPIFIGGTEALSISYRLRGEKFRRPLTHDLLDSMLRQADAKLVKVQVDSLRDGTFHGSVFIRVRGRVIRLDARPSDAIALAIGARVPIYVARAVLDEAGIDPDEIRRQMNRGPAPITS